MGSHNENKDIFGFYAALNGIIADPGSNGTFNLEGTWGAYSTIASGVRKLPAGMPVGVKFYVIATGSVIIRNAAGTTIAQLVAGQVGEFLSVGSSNWVAMSLQSFGTTGTPISTLTTSNGVIPIPLTDWREVVSNNIPNAAANGGLLATDTTPVFEFTNGDTDSSMRIRWAATNVDPIVAQVILPPDLDATQPIYFQATAIMSGLADQPVLTLDSYFTDTSLSAPTKIEDNTIAITDIAQTVTATIAAADVPDLSVGTVGYLTIEVTPASHGTDAINMYGTYIKYTKKFLPS